MAFICLKMALNKDNLSLLGLSTLKVSRETNISKVVVYNYVL